MIDAVDVRPWRLPMRSPFRVHGATVRDREGWLVRVRSAGQHGLGEAAPMAWFGTESHVEAGEALERARGLVGVSIDDARDWVDAAIEARTARAALHTALADLEARRAGVPLATHLGGDAVASVRVHVAVGRGEDAVDAAVRARAEHIGHLKLKLGQSMVEEVIDRIRDAVRAVPTVRLRLDANGAWSRDDAARWLDALAELPIDFVEQPVAASDVEGLVALAAQSPVPVAIDEGLLLDEGRAAALAGHLPVVMLKPMVLDGPQATVAYAGACHEVGARCVVTTFLDAAVGRAMATHVAAAVDAAGVHGLATGGLLETDLAAGPRVQGGVVHVPTEPGLGAVVEGAW